MTDKELKKLSRTDLVELLLEVTRENDRLRQELTDAREQLDSKMIAIENAGSLAEAALRLNGVFEAAQDACEQYAHNIQQRSCPNPDAPAEPETEPVPTEPEAEITPAEPESEPIPIDPEPAETQAQCTGLLQETQAQCDCMVQEAQAQCDRMVQETQTRCDGMVRDAKEQCVRMEQETQAQCDRMRKRAKQDADEYWEYVRGNARALHLEQHKSGQQDQGSL